MYKVIHFNLISFDLDSDSAPFIQVLQHLTDTRFDRHTFKKL